MNNQLKHKKKCKTWFAIKKIPGLFGSCFRFQSSIYTCVVFIIAILSVLLFFSFSAIFKSVNEEYIDTVIRQRGDNIGSIIEGSLYYSMLKNDKSALQSTLDIINTMPGIDAVNMYNHLNNLVYSSYFQDSMHAGNPDCVSCHKDFSTMFPASEKSYRVIDFETGCPIRISDKRSRQLLVRTPIFNERSCYTSTCHAHTSEQEVLGSLIVKIPLKELDSAVSKSSARFYLLTTFVTLLVFLLLIFFTSNKIRKPLNEIISASEAVSRGDRSRRLQIKANLLDDMKMVSLAFNKMLDNLNAANKELENWSHQLEYKVQKKSEELAEVQNELIHIERITSLGKLSSSVAHELNNPLSGILTYSKLISKKINKLDFPDKKQKISILNYLKVVESETKRCGDIVKGLLDFSKENKENFSNHHLHKILLETYNLMAHQMHISGIHFYTDFLASNDLVLCNSNHMKQVFVALLVNAREAICENGEITIKTENPENSHIKVQISDNGVGISPEDITRIFQPFFTTKQDASGIGLGLSIVYGIVQSHKGRIEVKSEPGKGTSMVLIFPLINE